MIETNTLSQPAPTAPANRSPWRWTDVLLIGIAAIVILIVGLVAIFAIAIVQGGGVRTQGTATPFLSLASGALEGVALIGAVYLVGLKRKHLGWSALGLHPLSGMWLLAAAVLGLLVIPVSSVIATIVQTLLGLPAQNPQEVFLLPQGLTAPEAILMILLVGVVGPFAEEIFFRGVLFSWLRGRWSFVPSALVSSLIFGAMHVEPSIVAATFVLGFVIAGVYEWSRSLWASVIIHAMNNTLVVVLLYVALAMGIKLP